MKQTCIFYQYTLKIKPNSLLKHQNTSLFTFYSLYFIYCILSIPLLWLIKRWTIVFSCQGTKHTLWEKKKLISCSMDQWFMLWFWMIWELILISFQHKRTRVTISWLAWLLCGTNSFGTKWNRRVPPPTQWSKVGQTYILPICPQS